MRRGAQRSVTATWRSGPTVSERRPSSSSSSSSPTTSRRQPCSVRTSGHRRAVAHREHDLLQVRARGDELVGETAFQGPRAHEGLGQRDDRRVQRARLGGPLAHGRDRRARAGALDRFEDLPAAAAQRRLVDAADLLELADLARAALGDLDERGVAQDRGDRAVLRARRLLAPFDELARDRAQLGVKRVHARQPGEDDVRVALVGGLREREALLARPVEPAERREPVLQDGRGLQQVAHVVAGVVDLLGAQRPRVPAREARALRQPHAEQLVQQRLVAELRAQPREAGCELRVEEVRDVRRPDTAQQRDVLAPGVHDDLDLGVGEQRRERRGVELAVEGVEHLDPHVFAGNLDRDLHEAQERPVAALAHELGVDAQPAARARQLGELRDVVGEGEIGHVAGDPTAAGGWLRSRGSLRGRLTGCRAPPAGVRYRWKTSPCSPTTSRPRGVASRRPQPARGPAGRDRRSLASRCRDRPVGSHRAMRCRACSPARCGSEQTSRFPRARPARCSRATSPLRMPFERAALRWAWSGPPG